MARERVAAHITESVSRDFGLEVSVVRSPRPQVNDMPRGDVKDGTTQSPYKGYREVIPPGRIGSPEGTDRMEPGPQTVDTVARYRTEDKDPTLHGAMAAMRSASRDVPFQGYATFQPRTAPMPRAAQDEGFLESPANLSADPLMIDSDSTTNILSRDARRKDLYGENRDGVLHNDGHPGFKSVQGQIAAKEGVSQEAAGAILANSTRHASASAKKANPRLKRVK
jgi:hypothetical protein